MRSGHNNGQSLVRLQYHRSIHRTIRTYLDWELGGTIEYVTDPFTSDSDASNKDPLTGSCDGMSDPFIVVSGISPAPLIHAGTRIWDLRFLNQATGAWALAQLFYARNEYSVYIPSV